MYICICVYIYIYIYIYKGRKLVSKHFPKHHKYQKIFNRKTIKCSYSCMPNMGSIIAAHNSKILSTSTDTSTAAKTCNCNVPQACPLAGECLTPCVVYKATVSATDKPTKVYYGQTEKDFKTRYRNHKSSFNTEYKRKDTKLSEYMWQLKEVGLEGNIKWEIARRAAPYKCSTRKCDLCTTEKLEIALANANANPDSLLNKRSEIVSACRHRTKFTAENFLKKKPRPPRPPSS